MNSISKSTFHEYKTEDLWNSYNNLLLSPDITRIRKLLVRYDLFKLSLDIPGDILECGVFKGAGLFYWAKLLEIYSKNSIKKIIGFDTFEFFSTQLKSYEKKQAKDFVDESNFSGISIKNLSEIIAHANLSNRIKLVEGDLTKTAKIFSKNNPGFKISLLHIDVDTYEATKAILNNFYDHVSRGGIIIFDEYAVAGWGETDAADEFFKDKVNVEIKSIPYSEKPTAYVIKP